MGRPQRERRGDELWCDFHHEWHHHTRFRRQRDRRLENRHGLMSELVWTYRSICRLAEQTQRVATKHEDEALHVVEGRGRHVVRRVNRMGEPKIDLKFVMEDLNYRSLIPQVRVYLEHPTEVVCPNCGYQPESVARLHFDHRLPPRHDRDWARLHARNVGILDHECNLAKGRKDYAAWLDLEEEKRISAIGHQARIDREFELLVTVGTSEQMSLALV